MGYSKNDSMVRVDYFKPSGKWYMTEALDMSGFYKYGTGPVDAVQAALEKADRFLKNFNIIVLKPFHELQYPVFIKATESLD